MFITPHCSGALFIQKDHDIHLAVIFLSDDMHGLPLKWFSCSQKEYLNVENEREGQNIEF